jgi:hypothetical protein
MKIFITALATAVLVSGCGYRNPQTPMQAAANYCDQNYAGKFLPMAECLERQSNAIEAADAAGPKASPRTGKPQQQ